MTIACDEREYRGVAIVNYRLRDLKFIPDRILDVLQLNISCKSEVRAGCAYRTRLAKHTGLFLTKHRIRMFLLSHKETSEIIYFHKAQRTTVTSHLHNVDATIR